MRIAIANDQNGFEYKQMIMKTFPEHEYVDCGTYDTNAVKYPIYGKKAAQLVASGACDRGILICGTGIGMSITANKIKGCYAAVCHDVYSTERSILSNNANIMCMGALVIGKKTCETLVLKWLSLSFDPTSHSAQNVDLIKAIEEENANETV
jgi:ribose 5-phosphate isomerase B